MCCRCCRRSQLRFSSTPERPKLSNKTTSCPSDKSRSARFVPMNPMPPVISNRTVIFLFVILVIFHNHIHPNIHALQAYSIFKQSTEPLHEVARCLEHHRQAFPEIGRASCRERGEIAGGQV